MQITDNAIINGLWGALVLVAGILTRLVYKITAKLFQRLKTVEEQVSHAITKTEVEDIVASVKSEFKQEHRDIIHIIDRRHEEIREDIREIRDLIVRPWSGPERRKREDE